MGIFKKLTGREDKPTKAKKYICLPCQIASSQNAAHHCFGTGCNCRCPSKAM